MTKLRKPISTALRTFIFNRDKYTCRYCGEFDYQTDSIEIDHLVPISLGGSNHRLNLVVACTNCNRTKSNHLVSREIIQGIRNESLEREKRVKEQLAKEIKSLRELEAVMND